MTDRCILGIDLGTSYIRFAAFIDGAPKMIADTNGEVAIPAVYTIDSEYEPVIGNAAIERTKQVKCDSIYNIKRILGRRFTRRLQNWAKATLPYTVVAGDNERAWIEINGIPTNPEIVYAAYLSHVRTIAESALGKKIDGAVITVPTHYNTTLRQAVSNAAKLAELPVDSIINETSAIALTYWFQHLRTEETKQNKLLAIVDFGGGRFDLALIGYNGKALNVKASASEPSIGGEEFDLALAELFERQLVSRLGIPLPQDAHLMFRMKNMAQDTKHELSKQKSAVANFPYLATLLSATIEGQVPDLSLAISRKAARTACNELLSQLEIPYNHALSEANITADKVDELVLAGGLTKLPDISKMFSKQFEEAKIREFDPDSAVAMGAVLHGYLEQGTLEGVYFADVVSSTLSIETHSATCVPIITRNTSLPAKASIILTTSSPQQQKLTIRLLQGESSFALNNSILGTIVFDNIPPAPRGEPDIEVTLEVDLSGMANLHAANSLTNSTQKLCIATHGNKKGDHKKARKLTDGIVIGSNPLARQLAQIMEDDSNPTPNSPEQPSTIEMTAEAEEALLSLRTILFEAQFQLDMEGQHFKGTARTALESALSTGRYLLENPTSLKEINDTTKTIKEGEDKLAHFLNR